MGTHSTDEGEPTSGQATPSTLQFDYIKSNLFRVIHADGALGGLTPSGMIHIALYNERLAIPRSVVHSVDETGKLGKQIKSDGRPGLVREVEVDVFVTIATAESLVDWLKDRIEEARSRLKRIENAVSED